MSAELETKERVDTIRRKLLRTSAVIGGGLALGHLPYQKPAVKSFFGVRSAWAQPSVAPTCGNVMVVPSQGSQAAASTSFSIQNTGPVDFQVTAIKPDNPNFTPNVNLPVTLSPQQVLNVPVDVACTAAGTQSTTITIDTDFGTSVCPQVNLEVECELCCEVIADDPVQVFPGPGNVGTDQGGPPSFMISNCGDVPFTIDGLQISPDNEGFGVFPIDPPMAIGSTLAPGETATIGVSWNPEGCEPDVPGTITILTNPDADCPVVNILGVCQFNLT